MDQKPSDRVLEYADTQRPQKHRIQQDLDAENIWSDQTAPSRDVGTQPKTLRA